MRKKYRDHLNVPFKYMPNGVIHIFILMLLPVFIIMGVFKYGLIDAMEEWWGTFYAKFVWIKK